MLAALRYNKFARGVDGALTRVGHGAAPWHDVAWLVLPGGDDRLQRTSKWYFHSEP